MEPIYLVQKGEYIAIACEGPTGAVYLVDGGRAMTLFTPKKQKEFIVIRWDREKAKEIAMKHNDRFGKTVSGSLNINLSKI